MFGYLSKEADVGDMDIDGCAPHTCPGSHRWGGLTAPRGHRIANRTLNLASALCRGSILYIPWVYIYKVA